MRRLSPVQVLRSSAVGAALLLLLAVALLIWVGWPWALLAFALAAWFGVDAWRAARWVREERDATEKTS
ncbi:hypothetical protein [Deinococcus yavapaiensis]|uniref:Uncharacterized protein n=1 Tax=Deinococcus yavapaiensis KR-236 TaxID=694435 RepID=A0A318SAG0_9DEIO|nr:hypothetical protein [Deinococcus yavapaiensis]PYE56339.1 hypothetical protein DES52_101143 [Deinococcus yavapaiensis KR-236]